MELGTSLSAGFGALSPRQQQKPPGLLVSAPVHWPEVKPLPIPQQQQPEQQQHLEQQQQQQQQQQQVPASPAAAAGSTQQDAAAAEASVAAELAGQLQQQEQQTAYWRDAFFKLARIAGADVGQVAPPPEQQQPADAYIQQVQRAREADPWVQVQAREAALQVQNAALSRENLLLRRELCCGWAAADPNLLQVRQIFLDPAIEQEFARMRSDLAVRTTEARVFKDKHEAANFHQDSKTGQALLNKVKLLAEENEELGRQRRQGVAGVQGALVAMERHHADDLRRMLVEVKDHCGFLEDENEELSKLAVLSQRRISDLQQQQQQRASGQQRKPQQQAPAGSAAAAAAAAAGGSARDSGPRSGGTSAAAAAGGGSGGGGQVRDYSMSRPGHSSHRHREREDGGRGAAAAAAAQGGAAERDRHRSTQRQRPAEERSGSDQRNSTLGRSAPRGRSPQK